MPRTLIAAPLLRAGAVSVFLAIMNRAELLDPIRRGAVLTLASPVPGADPGTYVLLDDPTRPTVRLCRAGEDAAGDICTTHLTVRVDATDLDHFVPLMGIVLELP